MSKKFELIENSEIYIFGRTLRQIRAIKDFGAIKVGDLGGFLEFEKNLSHDNNAWVAERAMILGNAKIYDNAYISERALITDHAEIYGNATVKGNAVVSNHARIYDNAEVFGEATISGNANIYENAVIATRVYGNAHIYGDVSLSFFPFQQICGNANVSQRTDVVCFVDVGSHKGTLTVCKATSGLFISRGCFAGTEQEFLRAIEHTHENNTFAQEYRKLLYYAKAIINHDDSVELNDISYNYISPLFPLVFPKQLWHSN